MNHTLREYVEGVPYCLAGAFFALLSVGAFAGGHIPLSSAIVLLGFSVLAFAAPFRALLIFIALSPIAVPLSPLVASNMDGQLLAELLLTVCLTGALFRFGLLKTSRRPLTTAEVLALVLLFLIATSALAAMGPEYIRWSAGEPAPLWTWHLFSQDYFGGSGALRPLYEGMPFIEGLLLFIVFGLSTRDQNGSDAAIRMLVVGAAAAAAFDIDKLLLVYARTGSVQQVSDAILNVRITMTMSDPNAAGSYFAMVLIPALALIASHKTAGIFLAAFIIAGEALAGSRTAVAALVIAAAIVALYNAVKAHGRRRAVLVSALVVLTIAAVPAYRYLAHRSTSSSASDAWEYRLGMWQKALGMTRDHPIVGVGVGEFMANSMSYPPKNFRYTVPENAHNQFLQVMAELGIPGAVVFVAIIAIALIHRYQKRLALALAIGIAVFLLTAVGGHPLLIRSVSYAFWTALAIAHGAVSRRPAPKALPMAVCVLVIGLVAVVPARESAVLDTAELEHIGIGVSTWVSDTSGEYRVASSCAQLYVPTAARRLEIAMRPHSRSGAALTVELRESGRLLNQIDLQEGQWTTVVFTGGMPDARQRRFSPIDLTVWRDGSLVSCGQPLVDVRKIVALP